jgi:thiol-disulfide isomerase/thioredoxin
VLAPVHMPSLAGATEWIGSAPLGPAELRGRVVLVNFWTLTCINWLRQEPYVRAWARAYRDDGLVMIGVHTPEFAFEHDHDLVRRAIETRDIDYPVATDDEYAVWGAFANHFWPALYFVDRDGVIRDEHFGEGRYEQSEQRIQELLGIDRERVAVEGAGIEAPADWEHLRTSETYLGYQRGTSFASRNGAAFDEARSYELPTRLALGQWGLAGAWTVSGEKAVSADGPATLACRFQARDAHLVLAAEKGGPIPFRVSIDDEPPGSSHGLDTDADGHGVLFEGRLYQLARERGRVRERTLKIVFADRGAGAYSFTFG